MKKISSILCNGTLITSLLFPASYLQSSDDWTKTEYAVAAIVAAGCAYGFYYVTKDMRGDSNHPHVMDKARAAIDRSKSITYENVSENNEDESIRLQLAEYKKKLNEKWIYMYQKGVNIGLTIKLSGTMTAANIFCSYLYLSGHGFVNNAIVASTTNIDGNFMVEKSQLGDVDLDRGTEFASFNNCLLGNIKSKNTDIIELEKSIVNGSIVFDKSRPGVVVIDKESIISGSLVNGKLVRNIALEK